MLLARSHTHICALICLHSCLLYYIISCFTGQLKDMDDASSIQSGVGSRPLTPALIERPVNPDLVGRPPTPCPLSVLENASPLNTSTSELRSPRRVKASKHQVKDALLAAKPGEEQEEAEVL